MYESKPYFYGTGRRKHSVARVRVYNGTGKVTINGRDMNDYFGLETLKLLVNSPLLILDEATSSIDTRTEMLIQEAFDRMMQGRTSFIVAHRLSTIRNADEILVMKDGSIIEQGNHEELMAKGGFYQNLYNSQFVKVSE